MSKFILGLMGLTLLGGSTLLGQTYYPVGSKVDSNPAFIQPTAACGSSCQTGCCQHSKTVCCPEHYCKEKQIVIYTSDWEKKCLPPCHGILQGCDGCDHGRCGHPITVKYLIKKVRICNRDATKCVPVQVPSCSYGRCSGTSGHCVNGPGASLSGQPVVPIGAVIPESRR